MVPVLVEIAGMKVSDDPNAVLLTYALGSCIAVIVYDPVRKAGGMIHYALPDSSTAQDRAEAKPLMFADTGVPLLFQALADLGCERENLVVKGGGGGSVQDVGGIFDIGGRNIAALKTVLEKLEMTAEETDVGGISSRSVKLALATGKVIVKSRGKEITL